ncbi:hypothetical protein PPERSA_05969 [Pseudocohnilembus persalinus]|uniref:Uncharacterized protein n=1 Tax=Pseudocohnilembus persalinus TaxID=266149 RepID=A0A0V0R491_PSEPJ|nr:hypothetical protein PPERSA_05969 [Pseudocohnilembus persalinus]|eukprot:KRX09300.1 hypothetical protein PPERSA_05969 [Pseudocohnilembus persalinus]
MKNIQSGKNIYQISPSLIGRLDYTLNHYQNQKYVLEQFGKIMFERADLEVFYQKGLEKCASQLESLSNYKEVEPNLSSLMMSLRSSILTHSEQAEQMAKNFKVDIWDRMIEEQSMSQIK